MGKEERFVRIYSQRTALRSTEILVDTVTGVNYMYHAWVTGVNYMYHAWTNTGGLTVMLDKDGKPVVSTPAEIEAFKK